MAGQFSRKRKIDEGTSVIISKRPARQLKKRVNHESDSSDRGKQNPNVADLPASDEDEIERIGSIAAANSESEVETGSDSEVSSISVSDSNLDTQRNTKSTRKQKRNDPEAFATSISKILGSKLSTRKQNDPVLSRSVTALQASKEITDQALERKVRLKLKEERKAILDRGRVKGIGDVDTAHEDGGMAQRMTESIEIEKRLRKTAHRGVVKLFNAVLAAQVKSKEAAKGAKTSGAVGWEERANEMSKKGFLKLISGIEELGNDIS